MPKKKGNYSNMRKEIDLMLDAYDEDLDTVIENLGVLMRRHGFRRRVNSRTNRLENFPPTGKQIDYAYDYLKSLSRRGQQTLDLDNRPKYYHQRADRDIVIDGKTYKKGRFIPRKR